MLIEQRFQLTIKALKSGHRYLEPLKDDEIIQIKKSFESTNEQLNQSLCILQNTSSYLPEIASLIIDKLNIEKEPDTLIHLLNVARRHIISAFQRDGQRLSTDFLQALKNLLHHKNWEVIEWTTRTIDECGGQALFFKNELLKIYPSKLGMMLNEHKRHTRGIIDLLLKKWRHIP